MKLILHIFKKDVRHHWPEILISIALICVYAWDQPRHWSIHPPLLRFFGNLLEMLPVLMILAWVLLVVRVVQSESLVGDRQFWITRPYEWPKLLAAKLLFALVWIHAPLFVMQLVLLKLALFPVLPAIPGLLLLHGGLFLSLAIPACAVASLNRGLGTVAITIISIIVYAIVLSTLVSRIPDAASSPVSYDDIQPVLCLIACVAIVFVQYRYRNTVLSWKIFSVTTAAVTIFVFVPAIPGFTDRLYPPANSSHALPAKLSFDNSVYFKQPPGQSLEFFGDDVRVQVPVHIDDLDEKSLLQVTAVKLELNLPTGRRWTSRWQSWNEVLLPQRTRVWPAVEVNRTVVEQFGRSPITGRLLLSLDVYHLGKTSQITLKGTSFRLPGDARCTVEANRFDPHCYSALRNLGPFLLQANLPTDACPFYSESGADDWAQTPAYTAQLNESIFPDFDLTPVRINSVPFFRLRGYENSGSTVGLCPGTTFSITETKLAFTTRTEIPIRDVRLNDLLPTYPAQIIPPFKRPPHRNPSDTLSLNSLPPGPYLSARR